MSVEDTASKAVSFLNVCTTAKTISRVRVSPGSAGTLVRRGGITNHHSISHSFSNTSAENYQNRLMCVEVIVCNISVVFWDTVYKLKHHTQWPPVTLKVICLLQAFSNAILVQLCSNWQDFNWHDTTLWRLSFLSACNLLVHETASTALTQSYSNYGRPA